MKRNSAIIVDISPYAFENKVSESSPYSYFICIFKAKTMCLKSIERNKIAVPILKLDIDLDITFIFISAS